MHSAASNFRIYWTKTRFFKLQKVEIDVWHYSAFSIFVFSFAFPLSRVFWSNQSSVQLLSCGLWNMKQADCRHTRLRWPASLRHYCLSVAMESVMTTYPGGRLGRGGVRDAEVVAMATSRILRGRLRWLLNLELIFLAKCLPAVVCPAATCCCAICK